MTTADATYMHTGTNTLSNELLGGTAVPERDPVVAVAHDSVVEDPRIR